MTTYIESIFDRTEADDPDTDPHGHGFTVLTCNQRDFDDSVTSWLIPLDLTRASAGPVERA